MKQILEAKLASTRVALKNAYEECDQEGITYHSGREELLEDLISQCNKMIYSFHEEDMYDSYYDEPWSVDEWAYHIDTTEWKKEEEIKNLYNTHYYHSSCLGKNIMSSDNCWFTSDEIEAFRVIWQRRISAV